MAEPWTALESLLEEAVADAVPPGFGLSLWVRGQELRQMHGGRAELRPRGRPVRPRQPFDLASLTKVLCTTPLALALVQAGRLDLDAPITSWLPDAPAGVSARQLLTHGSGLPAWAPLYAEVDAAGLAWGSPEARALVFQLARRAPVEAGPGQQHRYSDLGFLTLGALLEAVGGDRLDRLWERHVRAPSGADLRWGWPGAAATEDCPVRGRVIVGEVHDLNAAAMGGIAPHAGLFGSATEVARLVNWLMEAAHGATGGLAPALVQQAWAQRGPGSHRLGFDGVSPGASSAGPLWPLDGVGHLGFTGCSVWVAPTQRVVLAFLGNRVHPEIEGGAVPNGRIGARTEAFRALRPQIHSAVVQGLMSQGLWAPG